MSRYGIQVTEEEVRTLILNGLAGGDSDDECIDITEIVAILIIPYLRKVSMMSEDSLPSDEPTGKHVSRFEQDAYMKKKLRHNAFEANIIRDVLNIIMSDVTGSAEPQPLTKDLLRKIFQEYEEADLIKDEELIQDMIDLASGVDADGAVLNAKAFSRALTSDLELYDPAKETQFTTHYEDVFGLVTYKTEPAQDESPDVVEIRLGGQVDLSTGEGRTITQVFTFPQIDFLADSFRDKNQFLFAWLAALFGYFAYFDPFDTFGIEVCALENRELFECKLSKSIAVWFAIMGIMM